jgi:hypothetical protein
MEQFASGSRAGGCRVGITVVVLSVDALRRGRRAITMDAQR